MRGLKNNRKFSDCSPDLFGHSDQKYTVPLHLKCSYIHGKQDIIPPIKLKYHDKFSLPLGSFFSVHVELYI